MTFTSWNVRGLATSLPVLKTVAPLTDVFLLSETWCETPSEVPMLPGYSCIPVCRPWKHHAAARASGGLVCYVRECLSHHLTMWKAASDGSYMWLRLEKQAGFERDLFICLAYICPETSTHYDHPLALDAFNCLTEDIAEIYTKGGEVLLTGDFNARTAAKDDFILREVYESVLSANVPQFTEAYSDPVQRVSADLQCNNFGKQLLNLCQDTGLLIYNGRMRGDEAGKSTCHASNGSSVVDYFIGNANMIRHDSLMHVQELQPESDHCPLTLAVHLLGQVHHPSQAGSAQAQPGRGQGTGPLPQMPKLRYASQKSEAYQYHLAQSLQFHFSPDSAPEDNTCFATALQECIFSAATRAFGHHKPRNDHHHRHKQWYDAECKDLRKRLTALSTDDPCRASIHSQYKKLVKRKRRLHEQAAQHEMCTMAKVNPRKFWCRYKQHGNSQGSISAEGFRDAFKALFGPEQDSSQGDGAPPQASPPEHGGAETGMVTPLHTNDSNVDEQLHAPITCEEVEDALKRLKRHKAAGLDGIKAEFILDAQDLLLQPLTCTFNQMLQRGVPECWCEGVIHPIFKSGDENDPSNYRGITVTAVLAKLFAMVIEARMSCWAESKQLRAAGQAGFRKDHRTVDNMFIMNTLIELTKKQRGQKLYCCFVDFRKAFDSIPRERMWEILEERGLSGDTLAALKSMYEKDKACVLTQEGLSDLFRCTIGVKQGCPASPLLFGLYIDQLEQLLMEACVPPRSDGGAAGMITTPIDAPRLLDTLIPLLLFADDLALFSLSHAGLQAQLDILQDFCKSRGLVVNIKKTKVVVFEHRHSECEPFWFEGCEIDRVEAFKYLGVVFHETRGMSCAIEQLVVSARKALFAMYARCRQLHITDPRLRCQLFDALVRPILSYACEIWVPLGCKVAMQKLEQVHLGFLKSLLGVPVCTASKLVYAEFARAPLKHYCWKQCLRYKERMHAMDTNRLCKVAFLMACRNNSAWHCGIEARLQKLSTPPAPPDEDFNASTAITASADMYTTWMMQPDPESSLQQTYYSSICEYTWKQ